MSSARRYRKALKVIQQRRSSDEKLGRFGWLVGGVLGFQLLVLVFVAAQNGIFVRPLG